VGRNVKEINPFLKGTDPFKARFSRDVRKEVVEMSLPDPVYD
jgi:hypothetical protein